MAPKYKELSEKYQDMVFLKLDCNEDNKVSSSFFLCVECVFNLISLKSWKQKKKKKLLIAASGKGARN